MSSGEEFSKTWRKRQACNSCRKNKVRCEFSDPTEAVCIRCNKKGLDCNNNDDGNNNATSNKKRKKQPGDGIGEKNYAWIEKSRVKTKPMSTQEQRIEKISQLESIINEAKRELNQIKMESNEVTNGAAKPPSKGSSSSKNYLKTAVEDLNILSYSDAEYLYYLFIKYLMEFCPFSWDICSNLERNNERYPLCTLCMIYAAASTTKWATEEDQRSLGKFLETIVANRVYVDADMDMDIIYYDILKVVFIWRFPERDTIADLFVGATCVVTLDIGSIEDIKTLYRLDDKSDAWAQSMANVQTYITYYLCLTSVALFGARSQLFSILPKPTLLLDVMDKKTKMPKDLMMVRQARINLIVKDGVDAIFSVRKTNSSNYSSSSPMPALRHYLQLIKDLEYSTSLSTNGEFNTGLSLYLYSDTIKQSILNLYECSVNQLVFQKGEETDFSELWECLTGILDATHYLVNSFVEYTSITTMFPRFFYFRPLHGLTSLLRMRMLLWSYGLDTSEIDVENQLSRVKTAWEKANQYSNGAVGVYPLLLKVERWMVRLTTDDSCNNVDNDTDGDEHDHESHHRLKSPLPSSVVIQNLIRDLIVQKDNDEKSNHQPQYVPYNLTAPSTVIPECSSMPPISVTPAAATTLSTAHRPDKATAKTTTPLNKNSPEEIENILKELFSEII